jgi:hypothetical protein
MDATWQAPVNDTRGLDAAQKRNNHAIDFWPDMVEQEP